MKKLFWYLFCLSFVLSVFKIAGTLKFSWAIVLAPVMIPVLLIGIGLYGLVVLSYLGESGWWYQLTHDPSVEQNKEEQ